MLLRITTLLCLLTVASIGRAQVRHPVKCLTPHQIRNPKAAKPLFEYPTVFRDSILSRSGLFLIHYDASSNTADSITAPDYVQRAAAEADSAYEFEIVQLGYPQPAFTRGSHYDLFLSPLHLIQPSPPYGATYVLDENPLPASPSGNDRRRSYVVVDNAFTDAAYTTKGFDALRITIFHEFFHLVQFADFGWPTQDDVYFQEMSSVWMEWLSTPYVKDYLQYAPSYMNNLELRFDLMPDLGKYGEYLFAAYLSNEYGEDIVRNIWEQYRDNTTDPITAIDLGLSSYLRGDTWRNEYMFFGVYLIRTGRHFAGWSYIPDASTLPFDTLVLHKLKRDSTWSFSTSALSLTFAETGDVDTCITIIARDTNRNLQSNGSLTFFGNGADSLSLDSSQAYRIGKVCFNPLRDSLQVFPQPFILQNGAQDIVYFVASSRYTPPVSTVLDIYSISGTHVRQHDMGAKAVSFREDWCATWDGLDDLGHAVESGEYIYKLKVDGALKVGKIVVVRK